MSEVLGLSCDVDCNRINCGMTCCLKYSSEGSVIVMADCTFLEIYIYLSSTILHRTASLI